MLEFRASQDTRRILRVGVIHDGALIDERLLSRPQPVSVGTSWRNTFTLAGAALPAQWVLFEPGARGYTLYFHDGMQGRLALGQGIRTLDAIAAAGEAVRRGPRWSVALDEQARGKLAIGEITFLFQFVVPPLPAGEPDLSPVPSRAEPVADASRRLGGAASLAALLSLTLQVGALAWVALQVRPGPIGVGDLPDEGIRVMLADLALERPELDVPGVPERDGDLVELEPEVAEADTPALEPEPEEAVPDWDAARAWDSPAGAPEDRLRLARGMVRQEAFWSTFAAPTGGGGYVPILEQIFNTTDRDVSRVIAQQQVRGEGSLASWGSLPAGSGDWTGGAGAAVDVDIGQSRTAARASQVDGGAERERVRVRATVRHAAPQTAGTGHVAEAALNEALRRRVRDVERCYERQLADEPSLAGRVVLQFEIDRDGHTADVRLVENEVGPAVGGCIEARVRRWRFDPPSGGAVTVRKSYILMSSN